MAVLLACRGDDGQTRPHADATVRAPSKSGAAPAANADPRGAENLPDWDAMAAELRQRVEPRLPRPLASDRAAACDRMLEAVERFYRDTEPDPDRRARRLAELEETRADDRAACLEHTNVETAACVVVLAEDGREAGALLSPLGRVLVEYEFPWLLDQCTRAFST